MKNPYLYLVRQGCYVAAACLVSCTMVAAQVAVATYHNDNYRSGTNAQETILTPSNVNVQSFGKRLTFPVQGYVYAQPLYVPGVVISGKAHNVVYVATEHDQVYAFDANSGQQLWQVNFLASSNALSIVTPVSSNDVSCDDLVPEIGITGTPAIDVSANRLYVVAKTKVYDVRSRTTTFYQTLHVLDIRTGFETFPPLRIRATFPGTGTGSVNGVLTFDPLVQSQRPGLMIQNGAVFIAFASHCDFGTYHGWVMAFSENTLLPSGVTVDTPNGYEGGYWGGGSGLAADSAGSIYGATGNGYFDVDQGGIDYGDSILRLTWSSADQDVHRGRLLHSVGPIEPAIKTTPISVPVGYCSYPISRARSIPICWCKPGKEGTIDLVSRDNMGHFHSGDDSQIVQTLPYAIGGIWGAPAFWNNNAYFGGIYDYLKAFSFDPNAQLLSPSYTSRSLESSYYPGPTPSVSANGNANGIVWIIESDTYGGRASRFACLRRYQPGQ